jgi:DNA-binding transcriptional regulator YdaS (Cro superfamily)
MKEANALQALKDFTFEAGTQVKAARLLGISQAFLSDMVNGQRPIPERVLRQLGLRTTVVRSTP